MYYFKKFILQYLTIGLLVIYGGINFFNVGVSQGERTVRDVNLIDVNRTFVQHKRESYYKTYGFFIDELTGLKFEIPIKDALYNDFIAGGNKSINLQMNLNKLEVEHSSSINLWYLLAFVIVMLGGFISLYSIISYLSIIRIILKYRRKLH